MAILSTGAVGTVHLWRILKAPSEIRGRAAGPCQIRSRMALARCLLISSGPRFFTLTWVETSGQYLERFVSHALVHLLAVRLDTLVQAVRWTTGKPRQIMGGGVTPRFHNSPNSNETGRSDNKPDMIVCAVLTESAGRPRSARRMPFRAQCLRRRANSVSKGSIATV